MLILKRLGAFCLKLRNGRLVGPKIKARAQCEREARIPIATESLNAAMAATVALYEMTREPSHRVPAA